MWILAAERLAGIVPASGDSLAASDGSRWIIERVECRLLQSEYYCSPSRCAAEHDVSQLELNENALCSLSPPSRTSTSAATGSPRRGRARPLGAEIADGSDATYIEADATGRNATFQLATPPDPNFDVATAATIVARLRDPNISGFSFQVFKSDGVTPLTNGVTCDGTASFATVSAPATLSGSQTLSDWTNSQILVTANNDRCSWRSLP